MPPLEKRPTQGAYIVPLPGKPHVIRPSRLAAGMSYTRARSEARCNGLNRRAIAHKRAYAVTAHARAPATVERKEAALLLAVRGTTAKAYGMMYLVERIACPCCGSKQQGKLRLNANGKARLAAMRRKRAKA